MSDKLKQRLDYMRGRLGQYEKLVVETEDTIDEAKRKGFRFLQSAAEQAVKRQRKVLEQIQGEVSDLEKALGALPLTGGGKVGGAPDDRHVAPKGAKHSS